MTSLCTTLVYTIKSTIHPTLFRSLDIREQAMELVQRENPRTVRLIEYLRLLIDKQAGKAEFQAYESDQYHTL